MVINNEENIQENSGSVGQPNKYIELYDFENNKVYESKKENIFREGIFNSNN